ncbi:MAG TPA: cohesin domain-containing protein [Candidatus Paceibacterota bacterium]
MKKFILVILFFTLFLSGSRIFAEESSKIYFRGPEGSVAPGSTVALGIFLDSTVPINAFDLEVTYRADKLEFLGSGNIDSIVNIWQNKPSIMIPGKVGFSGGILKAFSGEGGLIINLSFKVLDGGEPLENSKISFSFSKSDLYLADGKGTKVETSKSSFSLNLAESGKIISSPVTPFQTTPENALIEKELENFKSDRVAKKIFIPFIILAVLIFVICIWAVYNKRKRKL